MNYLTPCDVYEANVIYSSKDALLVYNPPRIDEDTKQPVGDPLQRGSIYGGNNNERRTIYSKVNINSPVKTEHWKYGSSTAYVFGAGLGRNTWSEYTEVNLNPGAEVWEVYGGGQDGKVYNAQSVQKYMNDYAPGNNSGTEIPYEAWRLSGTYSDDSYYFDPLSDVEDSRNYTANDWTNLNNDRLVRNALYSETNQNGEMDERTAKLLGNTGGKFNTNVIINEGAYVGNYAYGGGLGEYAKVAGTTYIALLGGTVSKDIYAAGTSGAVQDSVACRNFTASANVYIKGGTCRNVYGGGWNGEVGKHVGEFSDAPTNDLLGETNVVIGDLAGSSFTNGIPAVTRNVYGGGEGAPIYGNSNVTINNGYIGYVHLNANEEQNPTTGQIVTATTTGLTERYEEKIIDDTYKSKETNSFIFNRNLYDAGCVFGGGYVDNSSVDKTFVNIYGGHVRNSAFGGGEIAAIGRGEMTVSSTGGKTTRTLKGIYRPGKTQIEMFGGHVHRNVFGGGRGYNNLNEHGKLNCDGYIFGQTEVHIHGGEIGTTAGLANGDGNVFGGGDIGYVYSAYENSDGSFGKGVKDGERYDPLYQGYYYKHDWDDNGDFVTIEVPTYYSTAEASAYNTEHNLSENQEGYKKAGDVKGTTLERQFTEDCKVLIEPQCKVLSQYVESTLDSNNNPTTTTHLVESVTINENTYHPGDYVPIADLNTMGTKNGDSRWKSLDDFGIIIHNAVFAGGNTSSGSTTSANTTSVFGNATASVHDIYHRDMITLGTGYTGGLYGDGNLTLVDGYRELNITNYGTDYYSIANEISISDYKKLPDREAAYYELKYKCLTECTDKEGTTYHPKDPNDEKSKASTVRADDLLSLFLVLKEDEQTHLKEYESLVGSDGPILEYDPEEKVWKPNSTYWEESGVLPVYAGRLMNSLQRADFCGVWGSRMVLQGAEDRVPETVDYTKYTINRVREVSLNKKISTAGDAVDSNGYMHGNYFGIYNNVNYLGALTSDFNFGDDTGTAPEAGQEPKPHDIGTGDVRTTDKDNDNNYKPEYAGQTFYGWKKNHYTERNRNNGNSHNKVALASGVYLELTTEKSTGTELDEKDWGLITGVVELDLINVQTGIGGGFVYAKNEHGKRSKTGHVNTTLTSLNKGAVTQWDYQYETGDNDKVQWETSGNFVHSDKTILDDCYNVSGRYLKTGFVPAHYWYIKGEVYVYDQYISAYTGNPNAFSETVDIPLTIAAASHGKIHLLNVQPNYYAYYASPGIKLDYGKKAIINDKIYYQNDPISYWDYNLLSASEKALFVPQTYVNCVDVRIDGEKDKDNNPVVHPAGTMVMTPEELASFKTTVPSGQSKHSYTDAEGNTILNANKEEADDNYIFRSSNNVSHNNGYILSYRVNNPEVWDTWYSPKSTSDGNKINSKTYKTSEEKDKYEDGPTYYLDAQNGKVLGQRQYKVGEVISENVYYTYTGTTINNEGTTVNDPNYAGISEQAASEGDQATFNRAYYVTQPIEKQENEETRHLNPGAIISQDDASSYSGMVAPAYICTKTVQLSMTEFVYLDTKMTLSDKNDYIKSVKDEMDVIKSGSSNMTVDEIKALPVTDVFTSEKKRTLTTLATTRENLNNYIVPAYYCKEAGKYGGNYYTSGKNYRAMEAWSSMSAEDRKNFKFNYDALDLLIKPFMRLTTEDETSN